jgi:methionine aminopeptidase
VIQLKSQREIELMAEGGKILAATVRMLRREVRAGVSTLDLDAMAEEFIRSHPGATPAFKGLYGFPGTLCTSINQEIVHGIPSRKRVLKDGDVISIDVGVGYQGYFTDSATTVPVGAVDAETTRLLEVTERSLAAGIAAAVPGNHLGDIGAAVQKIVESAGFSVVRGPRHRRGVPRGAAGAQLRQAEARAQAGARPHPGDRADGEHRQRADAHPPRQVDDRDGGRLAVGALRAHGGDHRAGEPGADGGVNGER